MEDTFAQSDSAVYTIDKHIPAYVDFTYSNGDYHNSPMKASLKGETDFLKVHLNLNDETTALLVDSIYDSVGNLHKIFTEQYKGITVYGTRYVVHQKDGKPFSMNGNFRTISNVSIVPNITESDALEAAVKHIGAEEYSWQTVLNSDGKIIKNGETMPKGEIFIYVHKDIAHLCYVFNIKAIKPFSIQRIFVDAHEGLFVTSENLVCHINNAQGTADTRYSGKQYITTSLQNGKYTLFDPTRGNGITTLNSDGNSYYDNDNNWTAGEYHNSSYDDAALDVHWGIEKSYDYYFTRFKRNSFDNKGSRIISYVNDTNIVNNSFWDSDAKKMHYGFAYGETKKPLASLDITGHELTHGVTQSTANLKYEGESGALNEGFSDIFAACIENYALPEKGEKMWIIGDDINNALFIRYMNSPNCKYYKGTGWIDPNSDVDHGGVHTNSGVLSFWFYLLANGGEGQNEGRFYAVKPIGLNKAEELCYTMLTMYLNSSSQYDDAVVCSIKAAIALYGENSDVHEQVKNAWYAVGLNKVSQFKPVGPSSVCDGNTAKFKVNTEFNYTVETSSNLKLKYKNGKDILVEGFGYSSWGQIDVLYKGKKIETARIWVGAPAISNISYSNGYFFAQTICDESNISSYTWTMNGLYRTTHEPLVYYDGTGGDVTVTLVAKNECGEGRSFSTCINVQGGRVYSVLKDDDTNKLTITGKRENDNQLFAVKNAQRTLSYSLVNLKTGMRVATGHLPENGGSLDFGHVGKGLYLFKLTLPNGKSESQKMKF